MNCPTQLHLVGHFYRIFIMMHGSMNVRFILNDISETFSSHRSN